MEDLRFLVGQEHACDYLPDRQARSIFLALESTQARVYSLLANQGFAAAGIWSTDRIAPDVAPAYRYVSPCVNLRPVETRKERYEKMQT